MPQRKFEQWLSVCLELSAPGGTCSMREGISAEAFLLFDPSMNPVFVSQLAVEVLLYPHKVELQINLDTTLSGKSRRKLLYAKFSGSQGLVDRLQCKKRLYQCRAVRVNVIGGSASTSSIALSQERGTPVLIPLATL